MSDPRPEGYYWTCGAAPDDEPQIREWWNDQWWEVGNDQPCEAPEEIGAFLDPPVDLGRRGM